MPTDSRATHTPGFAWGTPEEFDAAKAAMVTERPVPPESPPVQALHTYLRATQLVDDLVNNRLAVEAEMATLQEHKDGIQADIDEAVIARADARRVLGELLDMVPAEATPKQVSTGGIITTGPPRRL